MNETQRKERNASRLTELFQPFAQQIQGVIADLEAAGYRPRIQEAYRSPADQMIAFNTGHSKLTFGFHNVTSDDGRPEGLAVDLYDDDRPLNPTTAYLLRLSGAAWRRGLGTGVLWGLTTKQRQVVKDAIEAEAWSRDVRTGWDAWHIEPTGLTAKEAKAGQRPTFGAHVAVVLPPPPLSTPYTVVFAASGEAVTAHMLRDRAWLPLRVWGEHTDQTVVWQGEGLPILMNERPYSGEMEVIDAQTYSPVRDLAAFSGLSIDVDIAAQRITVEAADESPSDGA